MTSPAEKPRQFTTIVGELPEGGRLPEGDAQPFESVRPERQGTVERNGVKIWYAVWGDRGPWLAFPPTYQIAHSQLLKATVPYLCRHFRIVTMDGRGNGRSDRPAARAAYTLDEYYADFAAVLDAVPVERVALVAISAATMTAVRFAAERPEQVSHLVIAGGFIESRLDDPKVAAVVRSLNQFILGDYPGYLDWFFSTVFTEPHSTKPFEDGVRYGWSSSPDVMALCNESWLGQDVRELARR